MPRYTNYLRNRWVIAALLFVLILILVNLDAFPQLIEHVYSHGLFRAITFIQHLLFGWVPFSVGDVFYIGIVVYLLYSLGKLIIRLCKGRFRMVGRMLLNFVIGFEVLICAFYLLWGLNYFRPAAAERLKLQDTSYTIADVRAVARLLVDSINAARAQVPAAEMQQQNSHIYATAVDAVKGLEKLSPEFATFYPRIKPSLLSPLMNYMATAGYYNPFTGESQLNYQMPVFDRPFTACHELSHQVGFGREDEANFAGYLAGIRSNDHLLKYSAYYEGTLEFLRYLHRRDSTAHHQLKALLSPAVRADIKIDSLYWTGYEGKIGLVSGLFYDRFLKANRQPAGLRTYNRMILLTMAWYRSQWVSKQH